MLQQLLVLPARLFLGKGVDKKFPFLVSLYKRLFSLFSKSGEVEVNIPLGLKLFVDQKDAGVGMFLRTKGVFEPLQTHLFLRTLKKGNIVFDVGANVGYYTILASKAVGRKGVVYAFEPDPRNLIYLKKNVKSNNCRNVVIVEKALTEKNQTAMLAYDLANPGESSLAKTHSTDSRSVPIETITLDTFVKQHGIIEINVIKMDIEGAEILALLGAKNTLKKMKHTTLFVECNKRALARFFQTPTTLTSMLKSLTYKLNVIINEFDKTVTPFSEKNLARDLLKTTFVGILAQK